MVFRRFFRPFPIKLCLGLSTYFFSVLDLAVSRKEPNKNIVEIEQNIVKETQLRPLQLSGAQLIKCVCAT